MPSSPYCFNVFSCRSPSPDRLMPLNQAFESKLRQKKPSKATGKNKENIYKNTTNLLPDKALTRQLFTALPFELTLADGKQLLALFQ